MRLGDFSGIITTMFTDKMDITRYIEVTNSDGTTETKLPDNPLYVDVNCRISFVSEESPKDGEVDDNPVKITPKIFCKTTADIQAGDYITVRRFDDDGNIMATFSGQIGLPSIYPTHKEALFLIKESA
ncbi:MAG TPA: hypothetical protein PKI14_00990 [Fervidobacterium sp.]|nr:hypothetical protein [Fervidobacterium sp.]